MRRYDAHGNLVHHTYENGSVARYEYDIYGRPVVIETAQGGRYELSYDSRGYVVKIREPEDKVTELIVGPFGDIEEIHEARGVTAYRYVAGALVEMVRRDGSRLLLGYDALRRLSWMENAAGERYRREYDAAGNVARETSFAGVTTEYEYDSGEAMVRVVQADGTWMRIERDPMGRIRRREHSDGSYEAFAYNRAGAIVCAETPSSRVDLAYDDAGRLVREVQTAGGWEFATETHYDPNSFVAAKRYSTGWTVGYARRRGDGLPEGLRVQAEEAVGVVFEYDEHGLEKARQREGFAQAIATERDVYGYPRKLTVQATEGALRERHYSWTPGGPLAEVRDDGAGTRRYETDALDRPLRVNGLGASVAYQYSAQGTAVTQGVAFEVGADGRPTRVGEMLLQWDARGRLASQESPEPRKTFRFSYDASDRLTEVVRGDGRRARYLYDAFGRRLSETFDDGESTWFGWDGDAVVDERASTGPSVQRVFESDGFSLVLEGEDGRAFKMVASDVAGTPWLYLDGEGEAAEIDLGPWGTVARQVGRPGRTRFAGQRADDVTGLFYNRLRFYSPELHVFLTPDPMGTAGSIQDVGFVPNVTLYVDPFGLTTIVVGSPGDKAIETHSKILQKKYPGAKVIRQDQLGKPPSLWQRVTGKGANANMIDPNEKHVVVTTHGAPGAVQWGEKWDGKGITGEQLGQNLKDAGFQGGDGSVVDISACNAATPGDNGAKSVAHGVASKTGAGANGAMADPNKDPNAITYYPGKKPPKWQFWKKQPQHPYSPGLMSPRENAPPFVHQGSYVGVSPTGQVGGSYIEPHIRDF